MGQKVHPIGFRLGINKTCDSRWFSQKNYSEFVIQDYKIREYLNKRLTAAGISKIVIERPAPKIAVTIHASRPGIIIGKKGSDIEKLRSDLGKLIGLDVNLNIVEIRKPELDAKLVAQNIAQQIERRVSYRRAMKRAMQTTLRLGAQGMKVEVSGRLGGAEIARIELYRMGRVPLHTIRADIDFGLGTAKTTYGTCGVKVWIFRGEILDKNNISQDKYLGNISQPSRT